MQLYICKWDLFYLCVCVWNGLMLSFNKLLHTIKADVFWTSSVCSTGSEGSKRNVSLHCSSSGLPSGQMISTWSGLLHVKGPGVPSAFLLSIFHTHSLHRKWVICIWRGNGPGLCLMGPLQGVGLWDVEQRWEALHRTFHLNTSFSFLS